MRKKAISRKCKRCVDKAMNTSKWTAPINTDSIPFDHFHKIVKDSCKVFNDHIVKIILDYMQITVALHGDYRDNDENGDSLKL